MFFDPVATRRQVLAASAAALGTAAFGADPKPAKEVARQKYPFKKSINLWAFPYPDKMSLEQCLQLAKDAGFDGIELNYDLESDLSPKSGPKEFTAIAKTAERIGIAVSGLCSFLFWPYPLSSNDPAKRGRGMELAAKMVEAAHHLGTQNLLVVPGRWASRGGPTTSRSPTTCATSGPARPSPKCSRRPRRTRCR